MGQYYKFINLDKKEICDRSKGFLKLTEHSYIGNEYCNDILTLLSNEWKGDRVIHVGDYAEGNDGTTTGKLIDKIEREKEVKTTVYDWSRSFEEIEPNKLNDKMLENERRISTSNMIYLGDGYTDVPCMKLTKQNGGVSIAVYTDKTCSMAKKLLNDGRINYMVKSDYSDGSEIDQIVKKTINSMVINTELKNITYKQANE